ncbi:hypothetical protein LCGC14_2595240 [marine sediment metagenome]|uniref:Uncharacterized protein n=1 Tax=marine sediment metagenome TaxID=412755 RepID=A0A0F9CLE9_9ZZZZ
MDHLAKVEAWGMANGFCWPDAPEPRAPLADRYTWLCDAYQALGEAAEQTDFHVGGELLILAAMYGHLAAAAFQQGI